MVGIYKITSPSNKVYIGQSWQIEKRKKDHRNWKGDTHLANSIKKHGFDNHSFEVVHELPNDVEQKILDTYEQLYIDSYRDCGVELMNLREAGSRGKHSDESKAKQSKSMQGVGKGRIQSDEWKSKRNLFSNGNIIWLNKIHSEETKKKQSIASFGRPKSEEHKKKNIENLKKASLINKGSEHSDETIRKMQLKSVWGKAVLKLSLDGNVIKEYQSIMEASRKTGTNDWLIRSVLRGKKESYDGFKWKYKHGL